MAINVNVSLTAQDLREAALSGNQDDVRELIIGLDLAVADAGFTESVIKELARSLTGDMSAADYAGLLEELATYANPLAA